MKNNMLKQFIFLLTFLIFVSACSFNEKNNATLISRCQKNSNLEFYNLNSEISIYATNDNVSYIIQKEIYSAKWDDVDPEQMRLELEKVNIPIKQNNFEANYEVKVIGIDLITNLVFYFNDDNLLKLNNSNISSIINNNNIKIAKFTEYLQNSKYTCIDV